MKKWILAVCILVVVGMTGAAILSTQLGQNQSELIWGICQNQTPAKIEGAINSTLYNCLWMSSLPEKIVLGEKVLKCKPETEHDGVCQIDRDRKLTYVLSCKGQGLYIMGDENAWRESVCPPSDER